MKTAPAAPLLNLVVGIAMIAAIAPSEPALAHCDTVDGPVVAAARRALAEGDVNPVLKWVDAGREEEVEVLFAHVLAVRKKGDETRQLVDRYFFETLVRLHREGEGVAYTGLKAAGYQVSPAVLAADAALEAGSAADLATTLRSKPA